MPHETQERVAGREMAINKGQNRRRIMSARCLRRASYSSLGSFQGDGDFLYLWEEEEGRKESLRTSLTAEELHKRSVLRILRFSALRVLRQEERREEKNVTSQ